MIGAGGTLGALAGGLRTGSLVPLAGSVPLLLVSALRLEAALRAMYALSGQVAARDRTPARIGREIIGGSAWAGLSGVLRSRHRFAIALFMLPFTWGSAFLSRLRAGIVAREIVDRAARTA